MKKLVVNAISLRGPINGISRYTLCLFENILKDKNFDIDFFYGTFFSKKLNIESEINKNLLSVTKKLPFYYFLRELYVSSSIKRKIDKNSIYHNPSFISYDLNIPIVTNIHDISFITYPNFHPQNRVDFLMKNINRSVEISNYIIADCDFIRNEIIDYFKISPERVVTIPLGVSNNFKKYSRESVEKFLENYNLKYKKYFLSVSTIEPRKNIISAIKAYQILPNNIKKEYPYVIVGINGWLNSDFYELVEPLVKKNYIKILGHISDINLPLIYTGAKIFLYPSIYEGFGLPIIESFASGTPVITSNTSSMKEIAKNYSFLIDPYKHEEISDGIIRIINDNSYEQILIKKGLNRAKDFNWEFSAKKTIDLYNSL